MEPSRRQIRILAAVACGGALLGVVSDLLSGWSSGPHAMATPFSVDLESIRGLYAAKARWEFVAGNFLGVLSIPLHMVGFVLVYWAVRPAGRGVAMVVLAGGCYFAALGSGYHGTFAFVGDILQSGDVALQQKMLDYWLPWGGILIGGYTLLSLLLAALMLSGRTRYPRRAILVNPLVLVLLAAAVNGLLPELLYGVRAFFAVTGLNLALFALYLATAHWLLAAD